MFHWKLTSSVGNFILLQQQRFIRNLGHRKYPRMVTHGSASGDVNEEDTIKKKPPKARLTKLLDNASTFEDHRAQKEKERMKGVRSRGSTLPNEDAFMSSPYTKETKIFYGGESAVDEANRRNIVDPSTTSVILFPGQGTQYVGMGGESPNLELFAIASEILGFDLLTLCQKGPIEQLNQTIYSQPAIFVCSLSTMAILEKKDPRAIEASVGTAGYSIGEYAALVYAGALSFEDAVRLVKVRSEAMQIACDEVKSQMATILYGADSKLGFSLEVAREWATREFRIENPVCAVATHLFPHAKVVAGHQECIEFLQKNYMDFNLRKVKVLPVSGAFHTELMKPAEHAVKQLLKEMKVEQPRIPVFSNVTGYRYHSDAEVKKLLPKQIIRPVLWEQTLHSIFQRPKDLPYPLTYEVGPGRSLLAILKYCNLKAYGKSKSIRP